MNSLAPAIAARALGKRYRITPAGATYETLRERIAGAFRWPRPAREDAGDPARTVWALRDVSFELAEGEVVGLIGRNGAGKSTLLKVLSRITEPTEGTAAIRGRVGSLLEVGTGFHGELSGRDNVYLNGAILGMDRHHIRTRFDEIVAFAGVERFIDTPIKRYSTGMQLRLAFAVAAHLEPDILLVDEILAVGDAEFQRRCLGKMSEVAGDGRTVIFVSHHMASIGRLCARTIWLDEGRVQRDGRSEDTIAAYLAAGAPENARQWTRDTAPGDHRVRLRHLRLGAGADAGGHTLDARAPFALEIDYDVAETMSAVRVGLTLRTFDGITVFTAADSPAGYLGAASRREPGSYTSRCVIPGGLLNAGEYVVDVWSDVPFEDVLFSVADALRFSIEHVGPGGPMLPEPWPGVVCPNLSWSIRTTESVAEPGFSRAADKANAC